MHQPLIIFSLCILVCSCNVPSELNYAKEEINISNLKNKGDVNVNGSFGGFSTNLQANFAFSQSLGIGLQYNSSLPEMKLNGKIRPNKTRGLEVGMIHFNRGTGMIRFEIQGGAGIYSHRNEFNNIGRRSIFNRLSEETESGINNLKYQKLFTQFSVTHGSFFQMCYGVKVNAVNYSKYKNNITKTRISYWEPYSDSIINESVIDYNRTYNNIKTIVVVPFLSLKYDLEKMYFMTTIKNYQAFGINSQSNYINNNVSEYDPDKLSTMPFGSISVSIGLKINKLPKSQ